MSKRMVDLKVQDGKAAYINGLEVGGGTAVEANPQEEATQQLEKIKIDNITYSTSGGGGGNYNVVVQRIEQDRKQKFGVALKWSSGSGLKANTAYEVGDQVFIVADTTNYISVNSNQIVIPIDTRLAITTYTRLQFGDVIIVLTDKNIRTELNGDTSGHSYRFDTEAALKYTVVKAGTTGTDVTLSANGDVVLTYLIYSFGVTQAAQ